MNGPWFDIAGDALKFGVVLVALLILVRCARAYVHGRQAAEQLERIREKGITLENIEQVPSFL